MSGRQFHLDVTDFLTLPETVRNDKHFCKTGAEKRKAALCLACDPTCKKRIYSKANRHFKLKEPIEKYARSTCKCHVGYKGGIVLGSNDKSIFLRVAQITTGAELDTEKTKWLSSYA